jgi:sugar phosphate isomerase/epimerase
MPSFGVCAPVANASAVRAAGWDYVEEGAQALLRGMVPDEGWDGVDRVRSSPLPAPACNGLVPGEMKITGPDADLARLKAYMDVVCRRAQLVGTRVLVFGSGAARNIPEGFDRKRAVHQLREFAKSAADLAAQYNVTVAAEALNSTECNVLSTLAEAAEFVSAVNHPHLRLVVDTYHLWAEGESLEVVRGAMPLVAHVHVADLAGRVAPGEGRPPSDYRAFFRVLKDSGYSGMISVEALDFGAPAYARVLEFVRTQWQRA